jgi:hypothetical protein
MRLFALLLVVALAGCSATTTRPATAIQLSATLTDPTDIALSWRDTGPVPAARVVEFATEPEGQYTILDFLPAATTTYRHEQLMPDTSFFYRVRPVYGPASAAVHVDLPPGGLSDASQAGDAPDWAKPTTVPGKPGGTGTVRDPGVTAAATPTGLAAAVVDPNGIRFTWTDHASDEDGYLLEVRPAGGDFAVVDVLDPNVTAVGLVTLPTEKHADYRVRAFWYGTPSNIATRTTGE